MKNKGRVGLFEILQKEIVFLLVWQPSALGDNLTMWTHFLHPPTLPPQVRDSLEVKSMLFYSKMVFLLPSVWPGTNYTNYQYN